MLFKKRIKFKSLYTTLDVWMYVKVIDSAKTTRLMMGTL